MSSKKEKLAAARKKLREFQGKQRQSVTNKKVVPQNANASDKNLTSQIPSQSPSSSTGESSRTSSNHEHIPKKVESKIKKLTDVLSKTTDFTIAGNPQKSVLPVRGEGVSGNPTPNLISPKKSDPVDLNDGTNANAFGELPHKANESPKKNKKGLFSGCGTTHAESKSFTTSETSDSDRIEIDMANFLKDIEVGEKQDDHTGGNLVNYNMTRPSEREPKDQFWSNFTSGKKSNGTEPQSEDLSHISVAELIDENKRLTEILKRTQTILKERADEEEILKYKLVILEGRAAERQELLLHTDNQNHRLKVENEKLINQLDIKDLVTEELREKCATKTEYISEIQEKLEQKTRECEYLDVRLKETKSQLASSLIKIKQLTIGGAEGVEGGGAEGVEGGGIEGVEGGGGEELPPLNMRVIELQGEKASLGNKVKDLEKKLEKLNKEKEESNRTFQTYILRCNAQLQSATSEVSRLMQEIQFQRDRNGILEMNINDLEAENNKLKATANNFEIQAIIEEVNKLQEKNKMLEHRLAEKGKEIDELKVDNKKKADENKQFVNILHDLEEENFKLLEEREKTDRNEKLLAAMESDKIAAARAVSQNQQLKEQISELEGGFIKLSDEKLKLTDELAHEKHLNKEMELRLQALESSQGAASDHNHDHDKSTCTVTNDSSDINELKKIIRQLEEDKTELNLRLKSCNYTRGVDKSVEVDLEELDSESPSDDPENLKALLRQMEGKLKKTMNEIASLDEEREKLEHLVTQLQSETDTVGEYISLYQNQRMVLRKRSKEKDDQLLQLTKDKEELRRRLIILNDVVKHLLAERAARKKKEEPVVPKTPDSPENAQAPPKEDTEERIENLISEIESAGLINSQSVSFEHCPCCSGRLLNV